MSIESGHVNLRAPEERNVEDVQSIRRLNLALHSLPERYVNISFPPASAIMRTDNNLSYGKDQATDYGMR